MFPLDQFAPGTQKRVSLASLRIQGMSEIPARPRAAAPAPPSSTPAVQAVQKSFLFETERTGVVLFCVQATSSPVARPGRPCMAQALHLPQPK